MAEDGRWVEAARAEEVSPGSVKACWLGAEAVALVNVGGRCAKNAPAEEVGRALL